jgi:hypothetical protein
VPKCRPHVSADYKDWTESLNDDDKLTIKKLYYGLSQGTIERIRGGNDEEQKQMLGQMEDPAVPFDVKMFKVCCDLTTTWRDRPGAKQHVH